VVILSLEAVCAMHYLAIPMVLKNKQNKKSKHKEILGILQSIGIVIIKSKRTRVVAYTCRYSSELLIPNSVISG